MTRKKAIAIVVANVKMGWMPKWDTVLVYGGTVNFVTWGQSQADKPHHTVSDGKGWMLPRLWLESNGHLK